MGESFFDKFKAQDNLNDSGETTVSNEEDKSGNDSFSEFSEARERANSEMAEELKSTEEEKNDLLEDANDETAEESAEESTGEVNDDSDKSEDRDNASEDFDNLPKDFFGESDKADELEPDTQEDLQCDGGDSEGVSSVADDTVDKSNDFFEVDNAPNKAVEENNSVFLEQATVQNENGAQTEVKLAEQSSELSAEDLKEQYKQRKIANLFLKIDMDCTMPNLSSAEIADRAGQAKLYGLSSVCILASRMKMFKKQAAEQNFCAVIAYPSGEMTEKSKICEIREAAKNGAREIDVFFRISALKDEKRKQIIKSLKKYRFVIGKKKIFKISVDSTLITADEAEFIVDAAREAKIDYIVVHNCGNDERTRLFYSGLCAGKCKLEFADCAVNLVLAEKLTAIGAERFLLREAISVADSMREEINRE